MQDTYCYIDGPITMHVNKLLLWYAPACMAQSAMHSAVCSVLTLALARSTLSRLALPRLQAEPYGCCAGVRLKALCCRWPCTFQQVRPARLCAGTWNSHAVMQLACSHGRFTCRVLSSADVVNGCMSSSHGGPCA